MLSTMPMPFVGGGGTRTYLYSQLVMDEVLRLVVALATVAREGGYSSSWCWVKNYTWFLSVARDGLHAILAYSVGGCSF